MKKHLEKLLNRIINEGEGTVSIKKLSKLPKTTTFKYFISSIGLADLNTKYSCVQLFFSILIVNSTFHILHDKCVELIKFNISIKTQQWYPPDQWHQTADCQCSHSNRLTRGCWKLFPGKVLRSRISPVDTRQTVQH